MSFEYYYNETYKYTRFAAVVGASVIAAAAFTTVTVAGAIPYAVETGVEYFSQEFAYTQTDTDDFVEIDYVQ